MNKRVLFSTIIVLSSLCTISCIDDKESDFVKDMHNIKIEKELSSLDRVKAENEALVAEHKLRKAKAEADLALLAEEIKCNERKLQYELLSINDDIAMLRKQIIMNNEDIDIQNSELFALYANRYASAITNLDARKKDLINSQKALAMYKASVENYGYKELVLANLKNIRLCQEKIDTLKTYTYFNDEIDFEEEISRLKIQAGYYWDNVKVAERNYNKYDYNRDYVYDDIVTSDEFYRYLNSGRVYVWDEYYGTNDYFGANDMGYDWSFSYSYYNQYYYVYQQHYTIDYDLFTDYSLDKQDYNYISYSYNRPYISYYISDVYSGDGNQKEEYIALKEDYAYSANCINAIEKVYDYYVNFDSYRNELEKKILSVSMQIDEKYEDIDVAMNDLQDYCYMYQRTCENLSDLKEVYLKHVDIQDLIDELQYVIDEKTAQNKLLEDNNYNPTDYDGTVETLEAVIASNKILVDQAEKDLAVKKTQYEQFVNYVASVTSNSSSESEKEQETVVE